MVDESSDGDEVIPELLEARVPVAASEIAGGSGVDVEPLVATGGVGGGDTSSIDAEASSSGVGAGTGGGTAGSVGGDNSVSVTEMGSDS